MKEDKNGRVPSFKDIWTHVPTPKRYDDLNTVSDWIKGIIDKVDGKERRILIVDDEQDVLNSLRQILEHEGYQVDIATNGIEALDKLSRKNFSIVLSDIRMPAMDGIELSEACKNHPQLNRIPIILFSGYYDSFESCADYFLAKPIESQSLLKVIKKIFKKYQISKEMQKIGETRKKAKHFQVILIEDLTRLPKLQKILDFIWVFQPTKIPLFKISYKLNLSIDKIRELLMIIEKQDTILIVEESPLLRTLLQSELTFMGGNPSRIFDNLEHVQRVFGN
ncbi:MAG: response regulator [Candidatus Helarchaeota archaeon]|nr:response regulator [Candidatus Helarchaeota archaeon]